MAEQRLKGQDTFCIIEQDGQFKERIDSIVDCEVTLDIAILEEEYLGDGAKRFDTIFEGVTVSLTLHHSNKQGILLGDAAAKRGARQAGGLIQLNVTTMLVFPNGDTITILVPNLSLGSVPITIGGRPDYVTSKLEGKSGEYQITG